MSKVMIRDHGTALFQSHIPDMSRQHQTTAADGGHCCLANTLHKMREITFFKGCSDGLIDEYTTIRLWMGYTFCMDIDNDCP